MYFIQLLFLLMIFLNGCNNKNSSLTKNSTKDHQRFLNLCLPDLRSLNPSVGVDYPSAHVIKMLFEGLLYIDIEGKVKPAIAESYEISENKKTYIFHLRSSKWTNNDEITAYDFEYSWKKIINPQSLGLGVHNFYPIKNVQAIVQGRLPLDSVGIQALDAKTLKVELEHPTPYFLEIVATTAYMPVNAHIDKIQPDWFRQEGEAFVCNGPFYLETHRVENKLVLKKNPLYWDEQHVRLPGIQIAFIHDNSTQLSLFEKNMVDWVGNPISKIPIDAIQSLKKKGKLHCLPTLGIYWYFINTEAFPFNNKKMRQAFAYAINRQDISEHILHSIESPALRLLPATIATQEQAYFTDNNAKEAFRLFKEALQELGVAKKDLHIKINYNNSPAHIRIAEALQEQWNRVFGLDIKLEIRDWKVHYSELQAGNFQIGGMGWQSWLRDPIYILQTFRFKNDGLNMSRWENETFKSLLQKTEEEIDLTSRKKLFHEAEKILMEEFPVIPIYFMSLVYVKNEKLKNVYISELYEIDFRWAYFEE